MKNKRLNYISLIILLLLTPLSSLALKSDADKIAQFKADNVSFNYNNGATIYTGHVTMNQGTTHLIADKVTVTKDRNGEVNKMIAVGKQAHYNTLPDEQKKPIDAFGDTIEYYPEQKTAVIIGNGLVTQGMNSLQGPHIVYNMVNQTVVSAPSLDGGKSTIILQPQDLPGGKIQR